MTGLVASQTDAEVMSHSPYLNKIQVIHFSSDYEVVGCHTTTGRQALERHVALSIGLCDITSASVCADSQGNLLSATYCSVYIQACTSTGCLVMTSHCIST
jgi:hypothetical protein